MGYGLSVMGYRSKVTGYGSRVRIAASNFGRFFENAVKNV